LTSGRYPGGHVPSYVADFSFPCHSICFFRVPCDLVARLPRIRESQAGHDKISMLSCRRSCTRHVRVQGASGRTLAVDSNNPRKLREINAPICLFLTFALVGKWQKQSAKIKQRTAAGQNLAGQKLIAYCSGEAVSGAHQE
jgi:hypothetical protein